MPPNTCKNFSTGFSSFWPLNSTHLSRSIPLSPSSTKTMDKGRVFWTLGALCCQNVPQPPGSEFEAHPTLGGFKNPNPPPQALSGFSPGGAGVKWIYGPPPPGLGGPDPSIPAKGPGLAQGVPDTKTLYTLLPPPGSQPQGPLPSMGFDVRAGVAPLSLRLGRTPPKKDRPGESFMAA